MDTWSPGRYERFRSEREEPFWDLLALTGREPAERVADLGCGTGALTLELHRALRARDTVGVDSSPAMLERALTIDEPGLRFVRADIATWSPDVALDVLFSNAALQWLDDHPTLFRRLSSLLAAGGVIAVQMPANHDHPSHVVAAEVAREQPFASALSGYARMSPVLAPEVYAQILHAAGLRDLQVRLQVYCHELESSAQVVEWTRGTLLTDYERRLPAAMFEEYLERYRARLLGVLGDVRPYLFAFKRILIRAAAPR